MQEEPAVPASLQQVRGMATLRQASEVLKVLLHTVG